MQGSALDLRVFRVPTLVGFLIRLRKCPTEVDTLNARYLKIRTSMRSEPSALADGSFTESRIALSPGSARLRGWFRTAWRVVRTSGQ
jgi:hypothetical protein